MNASRCSVVVILACAACGDLVDGASEVGSSTGSDSTAASASQPADATGIDSDPDSGSTDTAAITGAQDSGTDTTTDQDTGTTTGRPPHETDWGLCAIEVTCDQPIVDEPKRSCDFTVTEADGYVVYDGPAGFEVRGRSSQGWPKHQYAVELWEAPNVEFVAPGSAWRYNDGPTAGGIDWMEPAFDDSGWAQGEAPLGYGVLGPQWNIGGQPWATVGQVANATTTGFGPDPGAKYITSWYRHEFEVEGAAELERVGLNIRADDGMIVYINGTEAARFNMPDGPTDAGTTATATLESLEEVEFLGFPVDPTLLVEGTNVVAVEVHQGSPGSSDVVMDLSLSTKPPGAPANFFEFGKESDFVLNGMYFDLSLYRNKFMYDLFEAFDPEAHYGPETHYCELTLNGDPRGIYTLGEKIKRDDDRIDIAPSGATGASFIFKSDVTKTWVTTNGIRWQLVYPKPQDVTVASAAGLNEFMTGFGDATAGFGNIWDYVDMDSAVDWVLLQEFARNGDAYSSSMHIYKDAGGKIRFVPWDFDIGLGGSCNDSEGWIGRGSEHWLNAMSSDPAFQTALVERWMDLRDTVMSEASLQQRLAEYAETMTPEAVAANFERWPHAEIIGGDDWVLLFRVECPVDSWEDEDTYVQEWIAGRLLWMDENIQTYQ